MSSLIPLLPDLWLYRDTCNVYVLRDANRALLIDLGDGDVLRRLPEIGINKVEWVLYTHHHREQCQGHPRLRDLNVKTAVPEAEADLFRDPGNYFRQFKRYSVEGAPYARPPREPISVDRLLKGDDRFEWGPYRLKCIHAPGHAPGMMAYSAEIDGKQVVFSGDLLRDDGKLDTFYDSEWDYGFGIGLKTLLESLRSVAHIEPDILLPSHGAAPLKDAPRRLKEMDDRLSDFMPLYLRDWDMEKNTSLSRTVSVPTQVKGVRRISPHLFTLVDEAVGHNGYVLLSQTGWGLMVDAGIFEADGDEWLDSVLNAMGGAFGLKGIEAVIVSHYHGDHVTQVPHLRKRYGTQVWAHEMAAEPLLHPERRNLTCLHTNYGMAEDAVPVDRILRDNEWFNWREFRLSAFHLPGQTEFGAGYAGEIDGRLVCFSGDNLFASPERSGHDAFISRNRGILEAGYIRCGAVLKSKKPDLILGGHSQEISDAKGQSERLYAWSLRFRDALKRLSPYPEYEYLIDPYWVEVQPFRLSIQAGDTGTVELVLANHRRKVSRIECWIRLPEGWTADPMRVEVRIPPRETMTTRIGITCPIGTDDGLYPLTVDVTFNGERLGEKFDSRLIVRKP